MLSTYLQQLSQHDHLNSEQCQAALDVIITDDAPCEQVAAFLSLLHYRGETVEELYGIITAIQQRITYVDIAHPSLDIVGTGGDGANTVNISTAAALLVASCGVKVTKHGNRAVSSRCGSADFLASLKIPTDLIAPDIKPAVEKSGFVFLFAPHFNPAMSKIKNIRQRLGIPTCFNLIGPLLNPARPSHMMIGVYDPQLMPIFAELVGKLKIKNALIVHGNGLDEISTLGVNQVIAIKNGQQRQYRIDPKDYDLPYCQLADLQGGNSKRNKQLVLSAFQGKKSAIADTITLNAGVALHLIGRCTTIKDGITLAQQQLANGSVLNFIATLQEFDYA